MRELYYAYHHFGEPTLRCNISYLVISVEFYYDDIYTGGRLEPPTGARRFLNKKYWE